MKLTRQEEVAILLVSAVAGRVGARVSLSDISREHGVSIVFLKKIARMLRQSGIIDSKEGLHGGYTLVKEPASISVLDILHAVAGDDAELVSSSKNSSRICPLRPNCMPQKIRHFISDAFSTYCSNITIDQLTQ
jgi:Rrf2 family protein